MNAVDIAIVIPPWISTLKSSRVKILILVYGISMNRRPNTGEGPPTQRRRISNSSNNESSVVQNERGMRQVNNVINQNNIFRRQGNTNASVRPQNTTLNTRLLQSLLPYQRSALQRVRDVIRHYTTNAGNTYINGDRSTTNSTPVHAHPRGQLFWLPTGAGKTTIAAGIVLSHMLSPGLFEHMYM